MVTLYLCNKERIRITDGCFETERRYADGCDYHWQVYACHGTLHDALSAYAQRKIRFLPNANLSEFVRAAEEIAATYQQIFNRALESGHGTFQRQPGR